MSAAWETAAREATELRSRVAEDHDTYGPAYPERTRAGKAGMPRGTAVKGGLVMVMVAPLPTPFRAVIRNRARRY